MELFSESQSLLSPQDMELDPQCRAVGGWRGPMAVGRHSEDMCGIKQHFDSLATLYII